MSLSKFFFLGLVLLCFSSCFEIIEEVNYNNSESGSYLLTANFSKSKLRLKSLMKMDTFMGAKIPREYEINSYIYAAEEAIKKVPGISQVQYHTDYENYIFTCSFDFDSTANLNKALNIVSKEVSTNKNFPYWNIFSSTEQSFVRNKTPDDSISAILAERKKLLELIPDASMTSIYRFQKEVKSISNPKAMISKNKKAVMLKQNVTEILLNPIIFTNTINF
jgi:hypothetical protein